MYTTHFGFRDVLEEEKAPLVRGVFDAVAPRYDVMNDAMSLGLHRLWKSHMIDTLKPRPGMALLDVAGGTGDIAFKALESEPGLHVTLCDINPNMLQEGQNRAIDRGYLQQIEWVCGNAETLPMPDRRFDAYTIAFGIRNVTHITQALREAYRVLKPGGIFLCLEFTPPQEGIIGAAYDWYSFHVIPRLGKLLAGDGAPYQYLVESIRRFPSRDRFATMIRDAGFARVSHHSLTGGVVALHTGYRL